jgi:hypothetical protein
MPDWMRSLAEHYAGCRIAHPDDQLLVVFDIDGTILDMRHLVSHVLNEFDRAHGTRLFDGLVPEDVDVHENEIEGLLDRWHVPPARRGEVLEWYQRRRWSQTSVLMAHRPYRGVLEVIRWFQIQPHTSVGLNTGRPESLRDATLRCLNELGREYKVTFSDDLLFMNPEGWELDVPKHKGAGIRHFQESGYWVVAVVDNEPEIIEALVAADTSQEILFLHADTLYQSRRRTTPRTVGGRDYAITSLVAERDLPRHVQLVWHGVNDEANLRQFLASPVRWGEVDVRRHPRGGLVLQHDAFGPDRQPLAKGSGTDGDFLSLERALGELRDAGKGVKVDVKQAGILDEILDLVAQSGPTDEDLWFNGRLDMLGEAGVRAIRAAHPEATIQCPIDFMAPLGAAMPSEAQRVLQMLSGWGVSRYSVAWAEGRGRELFEQFAGWGYEVNLYAVRDLEQFLRAVLMLPHSITADFNFPEWHYFDRGAGQDGRYHRYRVEPVPQKLDAG